MDAKSCVSSRFGVIMFFRKAPPQTEGRRHADPGIKTWPEEIQFQIHDSPRKYTDWRVAHLVLAADCSLFSFDVAHASRIPRSPERPL